MNYMEAKKNTLIKLIETNGKTWTRSYLQGMRDHGGGMSHHECDMWFKELSLKLSDVNPDVLAKSI